MTGYLCVGRLEPINITKDTSYSYHLRWDFNTGITDVDVLNHEDQLITRQLGSLFEGHHSKKVGEQIYSFEIKMKNMRIYHGNIFISVVVGLSLPEVVNVSEFIDVRIVDPIDELLK
jgi:hypothetical protein